MTINNCKNFKRNIKSILMQSSLWYLPPSIMLASCYYISSMWRKIEDGRFPIQFRYNFVVRDFILSRSLTWDVQSTNKLLVLFLFVWKEIPINNCYMYKFLHLNYKFTSVKSVNIVFVLNCRQQIGTYVEEIDKLYTIAL